jgi:hypothetical protein
MPDVLSQPKPRRIRNGRRNKKALLAARAPAGPACFVVIQIVDERVLYRGSDLDWACTMLDPGTTYGQGPTIAEAEVVARRLAKAFRPQYRTAK